MAGSGYRDWTAGEVPTAAQFDTYLQEQTVMNFASAAARDAALAVVKAEGMFAVPVDTNSLTVYSGTAWSTTGPLYGALSAWAPTVTQSGTVTYTLTHGTYQRVGRRITATCKLTMTGAGSASNLITVTLPVTAVAAMDGGNIGTGTFTDSSTGLHYTTFCTQANTGAALYFTIPTAGSGSEASVRVGSGQPTVGLATGDVLTATVTFDAAADA